MSSVEQSPPIQRPEGLLIGEEDWQAAPGSMQSLVVTLWEQVQTLSAKVRALEEQLGRNSRNSSRPPSSDPAGTVKREREPSGREPGGQEGHEGTGRPLKPVQELQAVIAVKPEACSQCGHPFEEWQEDSSPRRHQVTEIPPVVAETTEYQLHALQCSACGFCTGAALPQGVAPGAFGPRVQAMVADLSGQYHLSKRSIAGLLQDCFGVEIGLGTISALEQTMSEALAEPVCEAVASVRGASVANLDETGWRQGNGGPRAWLWTAVTATVTVFLIRLSRGGKIAKELLGETFGGILGSDRWSGYNWVATAQRQLCWSHLLREFTAFVERQGASAGIGQALLRAAEEMFGWWYRVRDGTLSREEFQREMEPLQARVGEGLRVGAECEHAKTAATCRQILKVEAALWTFVRVEGVEPTNNAAERAVRPGVLWRKGSFGTQTEAGSRFVERIMTVVATCKQQRRNVLDYLVAAAHAALCGDKAPSLLPQASSAN